MWRNFVMRYERPRGLLAGFHAEQPENEVPELRHVGEQWAPGSFFIREHRHEVWEFYFQSSGESRWDAALAEKARSDDLPLTYALRPGSFFAVAPGVRHRMHETPRARHHFFYAALDLGAVWERHASLRGLWANRETVFFERGESVLSPFRRLIREVSLDAPQRALGIRLALDSLVVEASRLSADGHETASFLPGHPAVARAREALEKQPNRPWTLNDLAREAGLSPSHLAEQWTRDVGVPPHRFLMQRRIEHARELLAGTPVSISRLALELGFASSQHFASAFKRLTGETATSYRVRHTKSQAAKGRERRAEWNVISQKEEFVKNRRT